MAKQLSFDCNVASRRCCGNVLWLALFCYITPANPRNDNVMVLDIYEVTWPMFGFRWRLSYYVFRGEDDISNLRVRVDLRPNFEETQLYCKRMRPQHTDR